MAKKVLNGASEGHGFDKNPQNINREGRPKKTYRKLIDEIKKLGYEAPTKQDYYDMMSLLLIMEEDDMIKLADDMSRPYWVRLLIIDLNTKKTRQRLMSDYRDWLFGRAEQKLDIDTKNSDIKDIVDGLNAIRNSIEGNDQEDSSGKV